MYGGTFFSSVCGLPRNGLHAHPFAFLFFCIGSRVRKRVIREGGRERGGEQLITGWWSGAIDSQRERAMPRST